MKAYVFALVFTVFSVRAEVSVTGVKVQPRSPWNGMVDVEYTVACDDLAADVYINPVVYDGDRRITMFPSSFTGEGWEGPVKAGKHKLVWDARKDFGAYSCANFQFKIYAGTRLAKYVKIDLSSGSESDNYPVTLSGIGPDVSKDDCRTTELWLRLVPPGEFWMGSPKDEVGRSDNETLHHVTFTKPFYIGVFEVTQKQWELVMGDKPSYFKDSENWMVRPVESVRLNRMRGHYDPTKSTGLDSNSFVSRFRIKTRVGSFDLPSESRWEYACRAGTMTALNNGKNVTETTTSGALTEVAACFGNSYADQSYNESSALVGTQRVGSFMPNVLGLYDMHGNVWEMCRDMSYSFTWSENDLTDPQPANSGSEGYGYYTSGGSYRNGWRYHSAIRGGSWRDGNQSCRSACRSAIIVLDNGKSSGYTSIGENVGFRICAEVEF